MKKIALLIDGGWFCKALAKLLPCPGGWPSVEQLYKNAVAVARSDEEIFRIFYYDCEPFGNKQTNPIDKCETNYANSSAFKARKSFFLELGQRDLIALRRGELKARGWELQDSYKRDLLDGKAVVPLKASDIRLSLTQKGVATLSLKRLVDGIVLFSGDTDMIPAMKLARREGIQVFLASVSDRAPWKLRSTLVEDSDGLRRLTLVK